MKRQTRYSIRRLGITDVYVEPVLDSPINMVENEENPTKIHLRVVDHEGDPFTELDLEWMKLDHTTLSTLVGFCEDQKAVLARMYLGEDILNPTVTRMQCWIDPKGKVGVEVLLSGER